MTSEKNMMLYTKSNTAIPHKNKITFNQFMKTIWMLSNTNLHYHDFKEHFKTDMLKMFGQIDITGDNSDGL